MRRALVLAALLCLAAPAAAAAGSFGVGVMPGWSAAKLADRIEAATGNRAPTLIPGAALRADAASPKALLKIPGVAYVQRLDEKRKLQFTTDDPLAPRQWYLGADKAFDFWGGFPTLGTVKVAVVDSGLDCGHPEFPAGRIFATRASSAAPPAPTPTATAPSSPARSRRRRTTASASPGSRSRPSS